MLSRWLRWLVITPVVLFVFGAILLSCTSGGSSGGTTTGSGPDFALDAITISNGPPPTPATPAPSATPTKSPKMTPTLTPRPAATNTNVPTGVPTGGMVSFDAIGTFTKGSKTQFNDITLRIVHNLDFDRQQRVPGAGVRAKRRHLHDGICGMRLYPGEQFRGGQPGGSRRRVRGRHQPRRWTRLRSVSPVRMPISSPDTDRDGEGGTNARSFKYPGRIGQERRHSDVDFRCGRGIARTNRGWRRRLDILHHARRRIARA